MAENGNSRSRGKKLRKLRVTLLQVSLTLLLLMGGAILYNTHSMTSKIVLNLSGRLTEETIAKIRERAADYLEIPAALTSMLGFTVGTSPDIIRDHERLWRFMWEPLLATPQLKSFYIADAAGSYVQVRRDPKLATRLIDRTGTEAVERIEYRDPDYGITHREEHRTLWDPRTRPWYQMNGSSAKLFWSEVFIVTTSNRPAITASCSVLSESGEKAAVVSVTIPLENLSGFLQEQKISPNSVVFLIDDANRIVAHPDLKLAVKQSKRTGELRPADFLELPQPWVGDVYKGLREHGAGDFTSTTDGERYVVKVADISAEIHIPWRVVAIIPERDLLGEVNKLSLILIAITLFILAAAVVFVVIGSSLLSRSIDSLANDAEKIKDFELDDIHGVSSSIHEISMLNDALMRAVSGLKSFRKYVPTDLVRTLIQSGREVQIEGELREVTVLMTDLRGFTAVSERLRAEEVVRIINIYLETMTDIILKYGGTIDEFIGDAILVIFGAPISREDHAARAVACAVEMQTAMEEVNRRCRERGYPEIAQGIGINTGELVIGNIGSTKRMKYGCVGRNVNLAARIESYTLGGQILISGSTRKACGPILRVDNQMEVMPKGLDAPVTIYDIGGVGGTFNVFLPEKKETRLGELNVPIGIEFTVLSGKYASMEYNRGTIHRLHAGAADIHADKIPESAVQY